MPEELTNPDNGGDNEGDGVEFPGLQGLINGTAPQEDEGGEGGEGNVPPAKPAEGEVKPEEGKQGEEGGKPTLSVTDILNKGKQSLEDGEGGEVKPGEEGEFVHEDHTKTPTRDYTGFTPDQVAALKAMPNQAFLKASAVFKEKNRLEGEVKTITESGIPNNYFAHPEAIVLSPAYKKLSDKKNLVASEHDFYNTQIAQIRAGQRDEVLVITGYDSNGQPQYNTKKITEDNSQDILNELATLKGKKAAEYDIVNKEATTFATNFSERQKGLVDYVQKTTDDFFPNYVKMDEKTQKVFNDTLAVLPEELQRDALANPLVKSMMFNVELTNLINQQAEVIQQLRKAKGIKGEEQQPSVGQASGGAGGGGEGEVFSFGQSGQKAFGSNNY